MRRTALAILGLALVTFPSVAFAGDDDDTQDEEGAWIEPSKAVTQDPPEAEDPEEEEPESTTPTPETSPADPAPAVSTMVETAPSELGRTKRVPLPAYYYTGRRKYLKPIPGADPPEGYVVGKRNKRGVWGGGIGLSAGSYLTTLLLSAIVSNSANDQDVLQLGALPLVGPFILAAHSGEPGGGGADVGAVAVVLGLAQISGFCMILGGSIARGPTWKRVGAGTVQIGVAGNGGMLQVSF